MAVLNLCRVRWQTIKISLTRLLQTFRKVWTARKRFLIVSINWHTCRAVRVPVRVVWLANRRKLSSCQRKSHKTKFCVIRKLLLSKLVLLAQHIVFPQAISARKSQPAKDGPATVAGSTAAAMKKTNLEPKTHTSAVKSLRTNVEIL